MSELKPCPICAGRGELCQTGGRFWFMRCACCCLTTGYYVSADRAVEMWNLRTQPANEPLRGMAGDKISIHFIGQCEGFYEDVIAPYYGQDEQYIGKDNGKLTAVHLPLSGYGVGWLAYRRKPEGSERC